MSTIHLRAIHLRIINLRAISRRLHPAICNIPQPFRLRRAVMGVAVISSLAAFTPAPAKADPFAALFNASRPQALGFAPSATTAPTPSYEVLDEDEAASEPDPRFRRSIVAYDGGYAPGTIVVDTPNTYLYFILGHGRAIRYGIGVGREGFTWSGVQAISRKSEWPDWSPPAEMIARQPYLPRFTAGGPGNPLGARAMYLGNTVYRIHGTNNPATIGGRVSSGCIRLTNEDVIDLYNRTTVGTKVIVLPAGARTASATSPRG